MFSTVFNVTKQIGFPRMGLGPGGSKTGTARADSKNVAQGSSVERLPHDRTIIAQTRPFSSTSTHTNPHCRIEEPAKLEDTCSYRKEPREDENENAVNTIIKV